MVDVEVLIAQQHGDDLADEHVAAGCLAGVALVAHEHALGEYVADVYAAVFLEHMVHGGGEEVLYLQQVALYLRIPHGPGAETVAALEGDAVGPVAVRDVFYDVHHHVVRYDACRGAYGEVVVAGGEFNLPGLHHGRRLFDGLGEPRVDGAVAYAALLDAYHVLPGDGRPGVHYHVFLEAGYGLYGFLKADPVAFGCIEHLYGFGVGALYFLAQAGLHIGYHTAQPGIYGRLPSQMERFYALVEHSIGKGLYTDIDDSGRSAEKFVFHVSASPQETISPARSAARALLGWMTTPYSRSLRACSATF